MTTAPIHRSDVMAAENDQDHLVRRRSEVLSSEERTSGPLTETSGHEGWRQRLEEDWQSHLETLQRYVCELLIKNQRLRTELLSASAPKRRHRDAINL